MSNSSVKWSYSTQELDPKQWYDYLGAFHDANIFQTAAFGLVTSGASGIEYFLLRRDAEIVAAALVRFIHLPLLGARIAYILWGPLWCSRQEKSDLTVFRQAIKCLRDEYVIKRRMCLRITQKFTFDEGAECLPIFIEEGYRHKKPQSSTRTILVNIDQPLDNLRKGLDQKWRNCLNRAERNGLDILEGSDEAMFELFLRMYRQMLTRKRIAEPGDIRKFMTMQHLLPAQYQMKVFVALAKGEPSAGAICSAMGGEGVYLFGATADIGMQNKAAYLVQWKVMERLKQLNCTVYDLHGVNAKSNPGVYAFKMGLCGKNGKEVEFAGHFDAYPNRRGEWLLAFADVIKEQRNRLKTIYGRFLGFAG